MCNKAIATKNKQLAWVAVASNTVVFQAHHENYCACVRGKGGRGAENSVATAVILPVVMRV